MSEGSERTDRIMVALTMCRLESSNFNRIYEAVEMLPDRTAERLIAAICAELHLREPRPK